MATEVTYIDQYGTMHKGYAENGQTYKDPEGTTPVDVGSIVFGADGTTYLKTWDGGQEINLSDANQQVSWTDSGTSDGTRINQNYDPNTNTSGNVYTGGQQDSTLSTSSSSSGRSSLTGSDAVTADTDIQSEVDKLIAAQRESTIAALKSAAEGSISNLTNTLNTNLASLDTTQSGIKDSYWDQRNKAAGDSDVGAYNFAQYMGSKGVGGNAAALPEAWRNMGLQNTIGSLRKAEAQDNANIDTQKALLQTNYNNNLDTVNNQLNTDIAAAGASIDAQAAQEKIALLKEAAANATATTTADKQAWLDTIGRFSTQEGGYQTEINRINAAIAAGDSSEAWKIPYLEAVRSDKVTAQQQTDQQTFLDTIGQYAGSYNKQADIVANDGDTSNDWQIPWLKQAAALEASNTSTGSGGGGLTQTWNQLYSVMKDIYTRNYNEYSGLSDAGKQALKNYATQNGGQYAQQLLDAFGITNTPVITGSDAVYNSVLGKVQSMLSANSSTDDIADYLTSLIGVTLSQEQVNKIATTLGII